MPLQARRQHEARCHVCRSCELPSKTTPAPMQLSAGWPLHPAPCSPGARKPLSWPQPPPRTLPLPQSPQETSSHLSLPLRQLQPCPTSPCPALRWDTPPQRLRRHQQHQNMLRARPLLQPQQLAQTQPHPRGPAPWAAAQKCSLGQQRQPPLHPLLLPWLHSLLRPLLHAHSQAAGSAQQASSLPPSLPRQRTAPVGCLSRLHLAPGRPQHTPGSLQQLQEPSRQLRGRLSRQRWTGSWL